MARRMSVSALRTSGSSSTTSTRRVAIGPVPPPGHSTANPTEPVRHLKKCRRTLGEFLSSKGRMDEGRHLAAAAGCGRADRGLARRSVGPAARHIPLRDPARPGSDALLARVGPVADLHHLRRADGAGRGRGGHVHRRGPGRALVRGPARARDGPGGRRDVGRAARDRPARGVVHAQLRLAAVVSLLDRPAHHHADRQHLRALLGGVALGLDLLRAPARRRPRRGGGRLGLPVHRLLLVGLHLGGAARVSGRAHGPGHQGGTGHPYTRTHPGPGRAARDRELARRGLGTRGRMRGMNNPTTSLMGIEKDFPFESRLSLTLLIKFWEDLAKADTLSGEHARSLLARLREVPALSGPIDDITLLDEHGPLVDALMSALFPAAFLEKAYMGALIPFTLRSVYGTHAFESIMGPDGVLYGSLNLDMQALKDFRLVNAYALALERLYGIEFPVDYPLI